MKTKLNVSAAVAAFIGISGVALADAGIQFTPVENLMPEQRQAVFASLSQMTNGAELDWDRVAVGVNENGQIVLVQKNEVSAASGGSPSSFSGGAAAATGSPSSFAMAASSGSPSSFGMAAMAEPVK